VSDDKGHFNLGIGAFQLKDIKHHAIHPERACPSEWNLIPVVMKKSIPLDEFAASP
jgi:hypothetical protein